MSMNAHTLIARVAALTGHGPGIEEYVTFGDPSRDISSILVAWCVDDAVIDAAVAQGCDCIVHHESLLHPYPLGTGNREREYLAWPVNQHKLARLQEHRLVCCRLHASADELVIYRAEAASLELGDGFSDGEYYFSRVFQSPVTTFGELIGLVKRRWKMPSVRVYGDVARKVSTIGLAWGGMGLFVNVGYLQRMVRLGADTIVCGETDSMGFRFCVEQQLPIIETSHEASENTGLREFASFLERTFSLPTMFYEIAPVWRIA